MNIVLLSRSEIDRPLALDDRRARHIVEVLRRKIGEPFDAGIINGPRGKAAVVAVTETGLEFSFTATQDATPPDRITVIVGLPRPQTARDILRDATTLGVAHLHFVLTEKSDANYARSSLWLEREWERHVIAGAEQAFDTHVPMVEHGETLERTLAALPTATRRRYAFDNYEGTGEFGRRVAASSEPVALALGPERGWTAGDRDTLRGAGFEFVHLGRRVLRAETAVVVALSLLKSARGSL